MNKRYSIPVYEPSSFHTTKPITVYDSKGNIFYHHKNSTGELTFNLPQGYFFSDAQATQLPRFYPYPELTMKDGKTLPDFSAVNFSEVVKVGDNPHKASIWPRDLKKLKILLDPKIAKHDFAPVLPFVIGHELWHTVYPGNGPRPETFAGLNEMEENCDRGSYNLCNSIGYNPSQIIAAAHILLERHPSRAKSLHKLIEKLENIRR